MAKIVVLFEHQDFIIALKPTAVHMHQADGDKSILGLLSQSGYENLYLVHRLDADTSGLMILATHQKAASTISSMFEKRQIEKYYVALSDKKPIKKQGHVYGDMKNIRNGNYALTRGKSNPAYTQFVSHSIANNMIVPLRLFILKPFTGKTHQLRVALKSVGAPILGDTRYSKSPSDRMYLHAWALKFTYLGVDYQFSKLPNEGTLFSDEVMQQTALLQSPPWSIDWPKPKAGFSVSNNV